MSVQAIKDSLHANIAHYVAQWLPQGKKNGHEYQSLNPNRSDSKLGSFSINLNSGIWADFASGDKGGDLISLYAYLFCDNDNKEAVKKLGELLNIKPDAKPMSATAQKAQSTKEKFADWHQVAVSQSSPQPPVAHYKRGKATHTWAYHTEAGALLGYIWRFTNSSGDKEILPLTLWQDPSTTQQEWRWKGFSEPRPLFNLPGILAAENTILLVEGEKAAQAGAQKTESEKLTVTTWIGGAKAIDKTDWQPLAGRKVILWPDNDEPGLEAMQAIAVKLNAIGCKLFWMQPLAEWSQGFDAADCDESINLPTLIKALAKPYTPLAKADAGNSSPTSNEWESSLFRNPKTGAILPARDNIYTILKHDEQWQGVIAYNDFTGRIEAIKPNPLNIKGTWSDHHDFQLGNWLANHYGLIINNSANLSHAVTMSAMDNSYHPIRNYLTSLPAWDGQSRLDKWLVAFMNAEDKPYTHLAGKYFLIGMVARVMRPGCKLDHMIIFEGQQGKGKSTTLRILGGEWFSDTTLDLGNKDSYQNIQGVWLQEIAELDSFNKKDSTQIKSFISSQEDNFREPYGRRTVQRPRQTVFAGSTNQNEYFKDPTGNRRFWPIKTGFYDGALATDKLPEVRDQLFAEALHRFNAGENWWPTREEENTFFRQEQEAREITDPREIAVRLWLSDLVQLAKTEFTSLEIIGGALDTEVSKIDNMRSLATAVGNIMARLGWERKRRGSGEREWVYVRPKENTNAKI